MPEVDKLISFNAFNILTILMIINIIITNSWEMVTNFIYYILSLGTTEFWFLVMHMSLVYIILSSLKIELGFRASIKLNL